MIMAHTAPPQPEIFGVERGSVILAVLVIVAGMIGWYGRRIISKSDIRNAATAAGIAELQKNMGQLTFTLSALSGKVAEINVEQREHSKTTDALLLAHTQLATVVAEHIKWADGEYRLARTEHAGHHDA